VGRSLLCFGIWVFSSQISLGGNLGLLVKLRHLIGTGSVALLCVNFPWIIKKLMNFTGLSKDMRNPSKTTEPHYFLWLPKSTKMSITVPLRMQWLWTLWSSTSKKLMFLKAEYGMLRNMVSNLSKGSHSAASNHRMSVNSAPEDFKQEDIVQMMEVMKLGNQNPHLSIIG